MIAFSFGVHINAIQSCSTFLTFRRRRLQKKLSSKLFMPIFHSQPNCSCLWCVRALFEFYVQWWSCACAVRSRKIQFKETLILFFDSFFHSKFCDFIYLGLWTALTPKTKLNWCFSSAYLHTLKLWRNVRLSEPEKDEDGGNRPYEKQVHREVPAVVLLVVKRFIHNSKRKSNAKTHKKVKIIKRQRNNARRLNRLLMGIKKLMRF